MRQRHCADWGGQLPCTRGLDLGFVGLADSRREFRITLTTSDLREVFNPLVTDVADAAQAAPDDVEALVAAVRRFERWRDLLQTVGDTGLSKESDEGCTANCTFFVSNSCPPCPLQRRSRPGQVHA